jgi:hypothetical protein
MTAPGFKCFRPLQAGFLLARRPAIECSRWRWGPSLRSRCSRTRPAPPRPSRRTGTPGLYLDRSAHRRSSSAYRDSPLHVGWGHRGVCSGATCRLDGGRRAARDGGIGPCHTILAPRPRRSGGSIGFALLPSILIARPLTRPVRDLATAARAFGMGDSAAPLLAIAPDASEWGMLVAAFAAMRTAVAGREEALRTSGERYRALFESNPHPMWVYDLDTRAFFVVNDAAVEHYGHAREEFLTLTIAYIHPPEDLQALR